MIDFDKIKRMDEHSHSEDSNIRLVDSINKIPDMIKTAYNLGYSGFVLTDHETVAGHVEVLQAEKELKDKGIIPQNFKCGLGNEIYLVDNRYNIERYWHYILIAKNTEGCQALRELSSIAWYHSYTSRGMTRVPTERKELEMIVKKYPNSLIATNACIGGFIGGRVLALAKEEKSDNPNPDTIYQLKSDIDEFIRWNIDLFGDDFYIEFAAGTSKDQKIFNSKIKNIAKAYNRKLVIGSDAHYLTAKERASHKGYLNSKEGEREVDAFYWDAHFMTAEEAYDNIKDYFSEENFIEICNNSMEIYDKIEGYNLWHTPIIPEVEVKIYPKKVFDKKEDYPILGKLLESDEPQERYWVNQCLEALIRKDLYNETYLKRLETEADIIDTVGHKLNNILFKYFNTFQHYINLFWECGSIIGPGRGSATCFLSNYLLGIVQLNAVEWGLPEWRFLNKERIELPKLHIGQYKIGERIQRCA